MVNLYAPVLALNSGMVPIDVYNVKEAVCSLVSGKSRSIRDDEDQPIRSQYLSIPLPRVIMLLNFNKIPKRKVVYSRLNIIYRDDMKCMYCGKRFKINELTIDHIIPISRWREIPSRAKPDHVNSWENQVAACMECNRKKGNKLLKEANMHLIRKPFEPKYMPFLVISRDKAEKFGWMDFLSFNARVVEYIET